jgi:RNA polymerase sigma-70 factor (ECF subfamily)
MRDQADTRIEEVEAARLAVLEAYKRHADDLSARAVILTRNRVLAQDVLQEVFLRFFLTRMHGERIADERAWLQRVMLSLIKDWKRSSIEHATVSLEDAESTPAETSEYQNAGIAWIPVAERGLAPRELECLRLRAEGFDYREIAGAMRIRIGTVGVLLNRAARKIRLRAPLKNRFS